MKLRKLIVLLLLVMMFGGCSNDNSRNNLEDLDSNGSIAEESKDNINIEIEKYEAKIEEALLMDNGYQDAKYTSAREELDKYLISSREQYELDFSSAYEGLTLDEALEYYNELNGTALVNITKQELADSQDVFDAIEQSREEAQKKIDSIIVEQDTLEAEAEAYFKQVAGVNLNRFEGITLNFDDYDYVSGKFCFNKKGTLQSESYIGGTSYKTYTWEDGKGGSATITFANGIVSSKTQYGLK